MSELTTCPVCGGSGCVAEADLSATDLQTLSDRDQTTSDQDQTWSDQDQTASDRDSTSSDEDQHAADQDFAAGGDPAVHERTTAARAHTAGTRDNVSALRDESAAARLAAADERDRIADEHDRLAEGRDRLAAAHEARPDAVIAELRLRAAEDRAHAAADRLRAAADRETAARERDEARRAQAEAQHEIEAAATDELTGVWSRRFGLAQITREIERSRRTGAPLMVAFADVDLLKEVNDSQGHAAGDRLLRLAADTMRASLRPYDIVVRYGGDEFLCAMPNISREAAVKRMTAIAAALSAAGTGHSISFGLAEPQPADGLDELLARADTDLLTGRNACKHDT